MHINIKIFHSKHFYKISIVFTDNGENSDGEILNLFCVDKFESINMKRENGNVVYAGIIVTERVISCKELRNIFMKCSNIISINRLNDEF